METQFGTDPEVFLFDTKNNTIVPPAALKEDFGIKFERNNTIISGRDWKIIEDGAATEINVSPSSESDVLYTRIHTALSELQKFGNKLGLEVKISAALPFSIPKYWKNRGESFKDCVRFGCDPDLDIYTGKHSKEISVADINFRYGGGHIHMQAPKENPTVFEEIFFHVTRLMDLFVGNTAVAFSGRSEDDILSEKNRLKFYGLPGKIRLQAYPDGNKGIEYRVPSNFWIRSPAHTKILLSLMNAVFNLSNNPDDASNFLSNPDIMDNAPKNIIKFDVNSSVNLCKFVCDQLTGMQYLSILEFDQILQNLQPEVKRGRSN